MQSYIPCSCKTTSKMLGQVNEKEKARKPFFKVVENGKSSSKVKPSSTHDIVCGFSCFFFLDVTM